MCSLGLGNDSIEWIRISASSVLIINGFFSDRILLKRGVRQGCPLGFSAFSCHGGVCHTVVEAFRECPILTGIRGRAERIRGHDFFARFYDGVMTFFDRFHNGVMTFSTDFATGS